MSYQNSYSQYSGNGNGNLKSASDYTFSDQQSRQGQYGGYCASLYGQQNPQVTTSHGNQSTDQMHYGQNQQNQGISTVFLSDRELFGKSSNQTQQQFSPQTYPQQQTQPQFQMQTQTQPQTQPQTQYPQFSYQSNQSNNSSTILSDREMFGKSSNQQQQWNTPWQPPKPLAEFDAQSFSKYQLQAQAQSHTQTPAFNPQSQPPAFNPQFPYQSQPQSQSQSHSQSQVPVFNPQTQPPAFNPYMQAQAPTSTFTLNPQFQSHSQEIQQDQLFARTMNTYGPKQPAGYDRSFSDQQSH